MKTRTLMLLALGCGLAIMLAGAVFLFQLTRQETPEQAVAVGETVRVGDMQVAVVDISASASVFDVVIELGGVDDDTPVDGFRMIASGRAVPLASTTCLATTTDVQTCRIAFDVSGADGTSRVLFYERGDERSRWVLGSAG